MQRARGMTTEEQKRVSSDGGQTDSLAHAQAASSLKHDARAQRLNHQERQQGGGEAQACAREQAKRSEWARSAGAGTGAAGDDVYFALSRWH